MKKKQILLGVILVLFIGFYSAYYYFSMNISDQVVQVSDDELIFSYRFDDSVSHSKSAIFLPFPQENDAGNITLSELNPNWYSVVHGLSVPGARDSKYTRVTLNQDLTFASNFYSLRSAGVFNDEKVRMLIGRPGHRGTAAELYINNDRKLARIPFPGKQLSIFLFEPGQNTPETYREVIIQALEVAGKGSPRILEGADQLIFPIINLHYTSDFIDVAQINRNSPVAVNVKLRISAKQKDVSLLPSRRFPVNASDGKSDEWKFQEPFFLFLKIPDSVQPLIMLYFNDTTLLNRIE